MSPADVCCVPTCPNHGHSSGQSQPFYFPFPTIPHMLYKWMKIILDPPNSKVCADHFASQDIIDDGQDGCGPQLKEGALPQFILRTGAYLTQTATRSGAAKVTWGPRGSPKRPPVAEPVAVSRVVKREQIAVFALPQVNETIAGSSSGNPTTTDSSLRQVHESEGPATDQVEVDYTASTSVSEVSMVNDGEEMSADDLISPNADPSALPWVCRKCQQGFSASVDLTRHVHKAHNVIVFPCEYCKKQFQTDKKLKFHKKFCGNGQGIGVPKSKQLSKADVYRAQWNVCIPSASTKPQQIGPGTKMVCKAAGGTHRADTTNISCSKSTEAMKSNSDNAPQRIIAVPMRQQLNKVDANHANTSRKDHIASTSTETQQVGQSAEEVHQAAAETNRVEPSDKTNVSGSKNMEAMRSGQKSDSVKTALTSRTVQKRQPKKRQVFQCDKCGKQLLSGSNFADHINRTCPTLNLEREHKHKCTTCGEGFRSKVKMANHSRERHEIFICLTCGKQISLKTDFMRHLQNHLRQKKRLKQKTPTAEETVTCKTCGKTFRSRMSLSIHRRAHSEKPYVCETCGKTFRTDNILKTHCMIHTEQCIICESCGKIFKNKPALSMHRRAHKTERPHVCDICGKAFVFRSRMMRHRRRHVGDKTHKCPMCDEAFYTEIEARIHLTVHTGERPWKCETCGKQYRCRSHLGRHVRSSHVTTPHHCGKCGRRFATQEMLDSHQREHEKYEHVPAPPPAPFTCSQCGRGFLEERGLKIHEFHHHKAAERTAPVQQRKRRKCKCVWCGKILSSANALTLHERTHTGEKPFVCTTCCKAFNNPQSLKVHVMLHTGEKPHKCRVCGKAFRIPQSLVHHETLHREKRDEAGQDLTSDTSAVATSDSPTNETGTNAEYPREYQYC